MSNLTLVFWYIAYINHVKKPWKIRHVRESSRKLRPKNAHADILPLPIGGQEAGPYCVEAEDQEEQSEENNEDESTETPCQFVTLYGVNSIYCSSNNMDTSACFWLHLIQWGLFRFSHN